MPRDRTDVGVRLGVAPNASKALAEAAARSRGLLVFCGPCGVGKTTLAQLVVASRARPIVHWLGDLRMPGEIRNAIVKAVAVPVVAVVRSGESRRLRDRWRDMKIEDAVIDAASVVTVTIRKLRPIATPDATATLTDVLPDRLVVEILAPDGTCLTGSLAEEASALVNAGLVTAEEARFMVPGYE